MKTFDELNLIAPLQRALAEEKYETPTPIQAQTIPAAMERRDVLGCAQTGTGKTAAFALPILERLGKTNRKAIPNRPFSLILAPTRELAVQIGESFSTYGKHLRLRQALVYGGVSQIKQTRVLKKGAHIIIATPGRLLDLMNQGHIKLDRLEVFVLDEADRMMDMGFLPDIKRIISVLPEQRQSLFFSATLPPKIKELAQSLLQDPVSVNVTPKTASVKKIKQKVLHVSRGSKQVVLRKILSEEEAKRSIVFTKTKRAANMLSDKLVEYGFKATAIHGNKSQAARQRALTAFRRNRVNVLVATDVAARGIDIDDITHVVNYDLPMEPENYTHRIGRTGRAGAEGIALSFCTDGERHILRSIEQMIGQAVPVCDEYPAPAGRSRNSGGPSQRRRGPGNKPTGRKPRRYKPSESKQGSSESGESNQFESNRGTTYGERSNKPKRSNQFKPNKFKPKSRVKQGAAKRHFSSNESSATSESKPVNFETKRAERPKKPKWKRSRPESNSSEPQQSTGPSSNKGPVSSSNTAPKKRLRRRKNRRDKLRDERRINGLG